MIQVNGFSLDGSDKTETGINFVLPLKNKFSGDYTDEKNERHFKLLCEMTRIVFACVLQLDPRHAVDVHCGFRFDLHHL